MRRPAVVALLALFLESKRRGHIYADCPSPNFNPLAVRRRTIHLQQLAGESAPDLEYTMVPFPDLDFRASVLRVFLRQRTNVHAHSEGDSIQRISDTARESHAEVEEAGRIGIK